MAGRYDEEAEVLVTLLEAHAIALLVLNGGKGTGMSLSVDRSRADAAAIERSLPQALRTLADKIEADIATRRAMERAS